MFVVMDLQVVFLMYLWSIDIDGVQVAMSCFALLCEEADIRCVWDEVTATVTYLLPNYHVYQELAAASAILTTGRIRVEFTFFMLSPFHCTLINTYCICIQCTYGTMTNM